VNAEEFAFGLLGAAAGLLLLYAFGLWPVPNTWSWVIGGGLAVALVAPRIRRQPDNQGVERNG